MAALPGTQSPIPPPVAGATAGEQAALLGMLLAWLLAVVIALWGAIREAGRHDAERRQVLSTEREPGPVPGLEGLLDHWALWAFGLLALGLALLALAVHVGRP